MNHKKTYIGYHGTNREYVSSIMQNNFNVSRNSDEWLGYGTYFFIEGISCPIANAEEWAINQAWDSEKKAYRYKEYSILSAKIEAERILDLRTEEDLSVFNKFRTAIIKKCSDKFGRDRNFYEDDTKIFNLLIETSKIDLIISYVYIKNKDQRQKRIFSRIPNSTVLVVVNPKESIIHTSIFEKNTGKIS